MLRCCRGPSCGPWPASLSTPPVSIAVVFLLVSLWGAAFTWNALRPTFSPSRAAAVSFFAGWLTAELALHHLVFQILATLVFAGFGALSAWPGWLGLAVSVVSWAGLVSIVARAREAEVVIEDALATGLGSAWRAALPTEVRASVRFGLDWREVLLPFPMRNAAVERLRNVRYGRAGGRWLELDVYRPRDATPPPGGWPVLLQVHGGAWVVGSKNEQGIPLMLRMARSGWLCVSIDYRLSPAATFPDHIVDVKRAIAWLRSEPGQRFGANPDFIVITGGSAGGHLSSLAALSANDPTYQPGFEDADTQLQGCVPFYGVYDFTDSSGNWPHRGLADLLERWVMKASLDEAPQLYRDASPLHRDHTQAPPMFVLHGMQDTLAPIAEARLFVARLRAASQNSVTYAEFPGAQHAWEIFPSIRALLTVDGVQHWLVHAFETWRQAGQVSESGIPPSAGRPFATEPSVEAGAA